jgi:NAD(P)-dependent dehydrogenase (short-subunit alcohol dehydrogenase family)
MGHAVAEQLIAAGAIVASLDRQDPSAAVDRHVPVDLAEKASIDDAVASLGSGWDGLLNIAGVPGTLPPNTVISVNFLGLRHLTESLLDGLNPGSAVVNVSSNGDVMWPTRVDSHREFVATTSFEDGLAWFESNPPEGKIYNYSKEVLSVYTLSKALEFARRGLRINAVLPGLTHTPLLETFKQSMGEERLKGIESLLGRLADPEDVASVIVFLASPESRWVNGQLIAVDGGINAGMRIGQIPLPGV